MCNPLTDKSACVGQVVGAVAASGFQQFFEAIANGVRDLLKVTSTFWMSVASPQVASGSGGSWTGSATILSIQSWVSPVAFVIFLVSLGIALIKIAHDVRRAGEGLNAIIRSLVTTLAGGLPILAATMLGIEFGDLFSPWILNQASGQNTSNGFAGIFVAAFLGAPGGTEIQASGGLLIIYLLAILGSIAQCVFMVVRGAMVIVLLSLVQVTAAGTATEEGWLRFKRIAMLIVGFVLYKPVAAIVYGIGLKLMSDGATSSQQLMNAIYGLTALVLAALALPAVIKFVAPAAAMGSSSAFSGGAVLGGLAAGAAVVALAGATGGAGAGAAGAEAGGGAAGAGIGARAAGSSAGGSAGSGGGAIGGMGAGGPGGGGGSAGGGAGGVADSAGSDGFSGAPDAAAATPNGGGGEEGAAPGGSEESSPSSAPGEPVATAGQEVPPQPSTAAGATAGAASGASSDAASDAGGVSAGGAGAAPSSSADSSSGDGSSANGGPGLRGPAEAPGAAPSQHQGPNPTPAPAPRQGGGSSGRSADLVRAGAQTVQTVSSQLGQGVDDTAGER